MIQSETRKLNANDIFFANFPKKKRGTEGDIATGVRVQIPPVHFNIAISTPGTLSLALSEDIVSAVVRDEFKA